MSCCDDAPNDAPPPGVLGDTVNALQSRFMPTLPAVRGAASGRGESFVSGLIGGGYVVPGGSSSAGSLMGSGGGITIAALDRDGGRSSTYMVLGEVCDQVVSPVTADGQWAHFSTPLLISF